MSLFEKLQQSLHSTHTGPVWGWAYTVHTQALYGAGPTQYTILLIYCIQNTGNVNKKTLN